MSIELPKDVKAEALASLMRYCEANLDERIGNIAAAALLNFFVEEIGPCIYNQAVADVQERMAQRVQELDVEIHEAEFSYWRKQGAAAAAMGKRR